MFSHTEVLEISQLLYLLKSVFGESILKQLGHTPNSFTTTKYSDVIQIVYIAIMRGVTRERNLNLAEKTQETGENNCLGFL